MKSSGWGGMGPDHQDNYTLLESQPLCSAVWACTVVGGTASVQGGACTVKAHRTWLISEGHDTINHRSLPILEMSNRDFFSQPSPCAQACADVI